ncbi:MAG: SRPBCC domain-containing protein [Paracoccaceae bacterium]
MDNRTMVLKRQLDATPETVWAALSNPAALPAWWGPDGFSCKTKEIDLRQGGQWRFDMIAPDGTVFPNRHRFTVYDKPSRIVYLLDDDGVGAQSKTAEITLTPKDGGTALRLSMTFSSAEELREAEGYNAVDMGYQTLGKLAAYLKANAQTLPR